MNNESSAAAITASKPANVYRWKAWWGGEVVSDVKPEIPAMLLALRKKVGGLQAKKTTGGPSFAIKSSKELEIKLRDACDELGIPVCGPVGVDGGNIDVDRGTAAFVKVVQRIGCSDGSYIDFVGIGHGADTQDKAAGKASTYARKDALTKGLIAPDKEMPDTDDEESPIEGGVKRRLGGKGAVAKAGNEAFEAADWKAKIAACKSKDELTGVVANMKAAHASGTLSNDVAVVLGAAAKAKGATL